MGPPGRSRERHAPSRGSETSEREPPSARTCPAEVIEPLAEVRAWSRTHVCVGVVSIVRTFRSGARGRGRSAAAVGGPILSERRQPRAAHEHRECPVQARTLRSPAWVDVRVWGGARRRRRPAPSSRPVDRRSGPPADRSEAVPVSGGPLSWWARGGRGAESSSPWPRSSSPWPRSCGRGVANTSVSAWSRSSERSGRGREGGAGRRRRREDPSCPSVVNHARPTSIARVQSRPERSVHRRGLTCESGEGPPPPPTGPVLSPRGSSLGSARRPERSGARERCP
jgi:hypothetical protein